MSIFKKIASSVTVAVIAVCAVSSGVTAESADDEQYAYIEMNMDYSREAVLENYERLMAENPAETGVISFDDGIMPYDGNVPKSYHNLNADDYSYLGSATGRLYTLKYFSTNSDGKIYLEGYFKTSNIGNVKNMWQNGVIEIYEFSTNKCVGRFDIDERNILTHQDYWSLFYYNFYIYNLDPNKLYYFGFVNAAAPTGLEVSGYISHHATYYFWNDVHGTNSFVSPAVDNAYVGEAKIQDNPYFQEIISDMRRIDDPLALYERSREL